MSDDGLGGYQSRQISFDAQNWTASTRKLFAPARKMGKATKRKEMP